MPPKSGHPDSSLDWTCLGNTTRRMVYGDIGETLHESGREVNHCRSRMHTFKKDTLICIQGENRRMESLGDKGGSRGIGMDPIRE